MCAWVGWRSEYGDTAQARLAWKGGAGGKDVRPCVRQRVSYRLMATRPHGPTNPNVACFRRTWRRAEQRPPAQRRPRHQRAAPPRCFPTSALLRTS